VAKRTASAKKQARAGVRRSQRNRAVRSEVKTKVVKARRTMTEGPVAESDRYTLALDAVRSLDRAAAKGILHRNNAARRKARLTRQMAKLAIVPAPVAKGKKGGASAGAGSAARAGIGAGAGAGDGVAGGAARPSEKPAAALKKK
jgi:small subunit ribosomal protein S20